VAVVVYKWQQLVGGVTRRGAARRSR